MFDLDKWQEIFGSITRHWLRTLLTAFGVGWGIFMLIVLMGAGEGLYQGVMYRLRDDATNSIWVYPGRTSIPYQGMPVGKRIQFEDIDYTLTDNMKESEYTTARFYPPGNTILWRQKTLSFDVRAVHPEHRVLEGTIMEQGRFLNDRDLNERRKVAVIGNIVAKDLFENEVEPLGQYINIEGIQYQVVGVFTDAGGEGERRFIYIPVTTAQLAYNGTNRLNQIMLTVGDASLEESKAIGEKIRKDMALRKKFSPDDTRAIRVRNNVEEYHRFLGLFTFINGFVWFVSIGTIMAGIIGVSNIMLIIVKERTVEIGVRKALGATPKDIISMIIQESVVITASAGYVGLLAGTGAIFWLNRMMENAGSDAEYFRDPSVNLPVVLYAILILVVSGALAGFFPAYRAAKVPPVVALRA